MPNVIQYEHDFRHLAEQSGGPIIGKAMKFSARAALFLLITGSQVALPQDSVRFKVGQPFPDLVLPSVDDGKPTSISAYRGKKVLLHIFASW